MNLVFLVEGQKITRVDRNEPVSDSEGYVFTQFVFNSGQNPEDIYEKIEAVFWADEECEYVELDGISGKCQVPDKFLQAGSFKLSLWASNGEVALPTNRIVIDVANSGLKEISRPDVYSKLEERISKIEMQLKAIEEIVQNKNSEQEGADK